MLLIEELSKRPHRLGELAEVLGTHKSTVLRTLQILEKYGWVRREGDLPVFSLGLRLVGLSNSILEELDIRKVARPELDRLGAQTKETVHLAVMDGSDMVYLDKVESAYPVRMYSRVGARAPLHCTGVGKVLLAYTPVEDWPALELHRYTDNTIVAHDDLVVAAADIRRRGWGWDEQEHEESVRCIAAPVFGPNHEIVAAVSVSVPTSRLSNRQLRAHVPLLVDVTGRISATLDGRRSLESFAAGGRG